MSIYNRYDILTEFAKKKKSNVRTCLNGAKDATGASQTFDAAKVQINSEITKQKLENLKEKYKNITNPYGFLTDLQIAMGLPRVKRASNYGIVTIPKSDGSATVSIRISNHSTNAGTYITNNANQEYNLSIVVRKRARKKTFIPHDDVRLDEYIYYGNRLRNVESPLVQIINSIIGFLDSGMYIDTTGVALHNTSPQQPTKENKQNTNISKNMKQNKQKIKLNEFTNGIRPSARVGHSRFNMEDLAYEIRDILKKLEKNGETLNNLIAQTLPWMDFNKMGEAIQTLGAETRDRASQLLSHYDPDDYAEKYDPEPDNNVNENKQTTNINKNMKKQTVKLNESKLRAIIKESIKMVLKENMEPKPPFFFWSISELRDTGNGFESYRCVEDSATSDYAVQDKFDTPEDAYQDGLKNLKYYEGDYELEVYYFTPNGAGDYVPGYMAEIHNGSITEY